jgi:hypothetical protein
MEHIPFAALPVAERLAVIAVLQRSGVPPRQVCVSKLEFTAAEDSPPLAMVSAPGWFGTYAFADGWHGLLEQDLARRRGPA